MKLIRGRDPKGSFYQTKISKTKYRYTAGDRTSREQAKKRALRGTVYGGGKKPAKKKLSSVIRAHKKLADFSRVEKTSDYRRAAKLSNRL